MIHQRLFLATTACLLFAHGVSGFLAQQTPGRSSRVSSLNVWPEMLMPEPLVDMGCDSDLWERFPPGAQKDILRFMDTEREDLAQNRVNTIKDILQFVETNDQAKWELKAWEAGVTAWEANEQHERDEAVRKAKEARKAKAKARREAEAASKAAAEQVAAQEAVAAKAAAEENEFQ